MTQILPGIMDTMQCVETKPDIETTPGFNLGFITVV